MASIDSDDDDFLALQKGDALPSPRKFLKRLKKKVDRKSEKSASLRQANSSSMLGFSPSTDPSFRSVQVPDPDVNFERYSTSPNSQSTELLWKQNLCARSSSDDDARYDETLLTSSLVTEPIRFGKDIPSDTEQAAHPGREPNKDQDILSEQNHTGRHPNEDLDNDDLGISDNEDESSSDSDEEIDDNDEIAVLNLLGKRRKSSICPEDAAPEIPSLQMPPASLYGEQAAEKTRKSKKVKTAELEEMHAASQRLLRETPNACFKPHVSTGKSVTSVLEKIRLRKMQLVQGQKPTTAHQPEDAVPFERMDWELWPSKNFLLHAQNVTEVEDVCTQENEGQELLQINVNNNAEGNVNMVATFEEHAEGDVNDCTAVACESDVEKSTYLGSGNAFRAPMEDTQDLLSSSQTSHEDLDENINLGTEEADLFGGSQQVNLHFDTETQDDYEQWPDEESNKENMEPTPSERMVHAHIAKGPSVRALIDDEAEDEDEDILVPGEDDEGDEDEDIADMVIEEINEKSQDRETRAELHRKWLEQQDAVMTDDILLRLKTGWRPRENRKRGLDFLDDEVELSVQKDGDIQESPEPEAELQADENSQDEEALKDKVDPDEARAFRSLENLDDVHESSDDEEVEQRMMRQRFLQESEEQGDLMSPADDETSREIFVLINKVNTASSNKKLKQGSVNDLRYLSGGTSNSNSSSTSKSSFLRRSMSSNLGSVQRQGSNSASGTRSFIFGRDDSNSSHSFDQHVDMREIKENLEPTSRGLRKESPQTRQGNESCKFTKPSATRLGPSLFEILRRQSTDMDHSLQKKSFEEGSHSISPIFAAFKPIKSTNMPRGPRRS